MYRKPTHTDRYLQFHSHHPAQIKRGLVKCLFDRVRDITRGRELKQDMKHLETVLQQNGYPAIARFIQDANRQKLPSENQEPPVSTMSIRYIEGLSEDIKQNARNFNIRTVFTLQRTLRQSLTQVKDQLPETLKAYMVYRITCSCRKVYIGETQRTLSRRIKEHLDACHLYRPEKSVVAEHAWCNDQRIDWDTVEIVDTAKEDGATGERSNSHSTNTQGAATKSR